MSEEIKNMKSQEYDRLLNKIYLNKEMILNELNKKNGEISIEKIENLRKENSKIEAELTKIDMNYKNQILKELKGLYENNEVFFSKSQKNILDKNVNSFENERNSFLNNLKVDVETLTKNKEKEIEKVEKSEEMIKSINENEMER